MLSYEGSPSLSSLVSLGRGCVCLSVYRLAFGISSLKEQVTTPSARRIVYINSVKPCPSRGGLSMEVGLALLADYANAAKQAGVGIS